MNSQITKRDRSIIQFIEKNGSLTISQCSKIFMPQANCAYKIAQRRLNKLVENNYLKVGKTDSNENIYYIDKRLSYHDLLVNSFYAELIKCGATNIKFETKKEWLNRKIISDAFFIYDYGEYTFVNFLEICLTHKKIPIDAYEELYKTGELQKIFGGVFPKIVVMDDVKHYDEKYYHSDLIKIVQIDFSLNDFPLIFID